MNIKLFIILFMVIVFSTPITAMSDDSWGTPKLMIVGLTHAWQIDQIQAGNYEAATNFTAADIPINYKVREFNTIMAGKEFKFVDSNITELFEHSLYVIVQVPCHQLE